MATSFDLPETIFFNMVEKDSDFFDYFGLTPEQSMELARERADTCIEEAARVLSISYYADIDFSDFDSSVRTFNVVLTAEEIYIVARFAYEVYLSRDLAVLKVQTTHFTAAEQNIFSPAHERRTFVEMLDSVHQKNDELIMSYLTKDRLTGVRKTIPYDTDNDNAW